MAKVEGIFEALVMSEMVNWAGKTGEAKLVVVTERGRLLEIEIAEAAILAIDRFMIFDFFLIWNNKEKFGIFDIDFTARISDASSSSL